MDKDTNKGYRTIIFVLAIITQTLFIFTGSFWSYLSYLSYIACFPIFFSILLWLDIKGEETINRSHLKPFSLTITQSLLIRWYYILFKKRYWIYIVVIYSSLLLLQNVDIYSRVLYVVWSILQTAIILIGMIVLNDFLEKKRLSRHLLTIPTLYILLDSLLPDAEKIYLLINPIFVGCAATGFLNINNFSVEILVSFLVFALLCFFTVVLNRLFNSV